MNSKLKRLIIIQCLGTLNDNLFRNAITVYCTFGLFQFFNLSPEKLVPLVGIIYILPIFLFSDLTGQISDFYPKIRIIRIIKIFELVVMGLVILGFSFQMHFLLLICLFLLGLHSAVFGPLKYSFVSEIVEPKSLLQANSLIEAGTFLCLVVGTLVGGFLILKQEIVLILYIFLILNSCFSVYQCFKIKDQNTQIIRKKISYIPFSSLFYIYKKYKFDKIVIFELLGYAWFWFYAGCILSLLPTFTKKFLSADAFSVSLTISIFSVGIAFGALILDKVCKGKINLGIVSFSSLSMGLFLFFFCILILFYPSVQSDVDLGFLSLSQYFVFWIYHLLLFFISMSCAFFIIPLFTDLQKRTKEQDKSTMFSVSNVINSMFMILGLLYSLYLQAQGLSIAKIFFIVAFLNIAVSFIFYLHYPVETLRVLGRLLCKIFYNFRIKSNTNIPDQGSLVLVCNHVSFIDWLFIGSFFSRPVRFVMYYQFMNIPLAKFLFKQGGVIPIAGKLENKDIFEKAFLEVSLALKNGEVVCIFPEGQLTKDGQMSVFKSGISHVLNKDLAPVLPMSLKGLWGSYFSYHKGRAMSGLPIPKRRKVDLSIGQLMPAHEIKMYLESNTLPEVLSAKVEELLK